MPKDYGDGESLANASWARVQPALRGRYTFVRWLGAGAFGDVCEALQESTGQRVAIKLLRAINQPNTRSRFVREMRACAVLHHPSVVRVLDAGSAFDPFEEGTLPLFTVFEYVPGQSLEQMLAVRGLLTVHETNNLMLQVMDGLLAAHDLGIVHRDLKPSNVMVTPTAGGPKAKILDFGVAGVVSGQIDAPIVTGTGDRIGTPAYCAPEQLQGQPPTPRMDYYAWALVYLECITGRRVFAGHTLADILYAQLSAEPVPLPDSLVGHPLGDLLRPLLEKDPTRRLGNVRDLLVELPKLAYGSAVDADGFLRGASPASRAILPRTELLATPRSPSDSRHACALCCRIDLSGAPAALPDALLDDWLRESRRTLVETCARYGGKLAGCAAGELLFYFAVDESDEESTHRAARAALAMRDLRLPGRASPPDSQASLRMRIGIHLGAVTRRAIETADCLCALSLPASQMCDLCKTGEIACSAPAFGRLKEAMTWTQSRTCPGTVFLLTSPKGERSAHLS